MLRYQENWRSQSQSEKQAQKQLCFFPAVMSPPSLGVTQNSERTRPAAAGSGPPRGNRAAAVAWHYSLHRAGFSQTWRSCAPVHMEHSRLFWKPRVLDWEVEMSNGCLTRGAVRGLTACWCGNQPSHARGRRTLPPAPSTGRRGPSLRTASSHDRANPAVLQKMLSDDLLQLPCDG